MSENNETIQQSSYDAWRQAQASSSDHQVVADEWTDGPLSDLTDAIRMPSSMQRITPDPFSDSTPLVCSTDPGEICEACQ